MTMTFRQQAEHVVNNGINWTFRPDGGLSPVAFVRCPRCGEQIEQVGTNGNGWAYGVTAIRLILVALVEAHLSEEHA